MTVWQAILVELFLTRWALGSKGLLIVMAVTAVVLIANAEFRRMLYGAYLGPDI